MIRQDFARKRLPDSPGVYQFKKGRKILYIGKASSLRDRVRSYFRDDLVETRSQWVAKMLREADGVSFQKTDSVLEALLLEAELIKKFAPPYNTEGKDDKSYNCAVITKEDFPRVLVVRKHELDSSLLRIKDKGLRIVQIYGPFTSGTQLKTALKIIRRIFPFRDSCAPHNADERRYKKTPISADTSASISIPIRDNLRRACFNRQIGLCPGVCTGEISKREYGMTIRHIRLFFEGKKKKLVSELKREMKNYAKKQEFEKANEVKRKIFALQHIQDIALIKSYSLTAKRSTQSTTIALNASFRIEGYDVAHLGGTSAVGVMTVIENSEPNKAEYRMFKIKDARGGDDVGALREILSRRLKHKEWRMPNLIVVDGGAAQRNGSIAEIRKSLSVSDSIPVVSVVKDEHHRPRAIFDLDSHNYLRLSASTHLRSSAILLANSEAHRFAIKFHRKRRGLDIDH